MHRLRIGGHWTTDSNEMNIKRVPLIIPFLFRSFVQSFLDVIWLFACLMTCPQLVRAAQWQSGQLAVDCLFSTFLLQRAFFFISLLRRRKRKRRDQCTDSSFYCVSSSRPLTPRRTPGGWEDGECSYKHRHSTAHLEFLFLLFPIDKHWDKQQKGEENSKDVDVSNTRVDRQVPTQHDATRR